MREKMKAMIDVAEGAITLAGLCEDQQEPWLGAFIKNVEAALALPDDDPWRDLKDLPVGDCLERDDLPVLFDRVILEIKYKEGAPGTNEVVIASLSPVSNTLEWIGDDSREEISSYATGVRWQPLPEPSGKEGVSDEG